jgi:hypothetical protein
MLTPSERQQLIDKMSRLPEELAACVNGLSEAQLTTVFIPGEWTVAQNVHHVADSHINAFIRMKLVLTEEKPTLKPYDQEIWAGMADSVSSDMAASMEIISGLHRRWVIMLGAIEDESAWQRTAFHPEIGDITLDDLLRIYGNHGHGHIDQIKQALAAR